jgi:hypothetical protein
MEFFFADVKHPSEEMSLGNEERQGEWVEI